MISTAKVLIPEKEWLVQDGNRKICSISKVKKGYVVLHNGQSVPFKDLADIKSAFGVAMFEESIRKVKKDIDKSSEYVIYDYPCKTKPHEPLYNVKKKLPLYTKRLKSKSQHCAGHYIIKFRKGWVKSFCPKLITLERYPYQGPWKSEEESRVALKKANQLCNND
jgi:hypothetical protein